MITKITPLLSRYKGSEVSKEQHKDASAWLVVVSLSLEKHIAFLFEIVAMDAERCSISAPMFSGGAGVFAVFYLLAMTLHFVVVSQWTECFPTATPTTSFVVGDKRCIL